MAKQSENKLTLFFFNKNGKTLFFNILIYLPKNIEKAPLFLGYNFYGNHTICYDVNIRISDAWTRDNDSFGISNNQLTEKSRGVRKREVAGKQNY